MNPTRARIRLVDLAVALLLSPIWGPLLLLGIALAATQGLPIFYYADRLGRSGRPFRMLKLRTMVRDADRLGAAVSTGDDPRITAAGKPRRRDKLDEAPPFLRVLFGRKAIQGPPPQGPAYLAPYTPPGRLALHTEPRGKGFRCFHF